MEIGNPGEQRDRLLALVLAGPKVATTGLLEEYEEEGEAVEHVGERLVLLDSDGRDSGEIEITRVAVVAWSMVTWEHARSEGEGDASLEEWREGHRRHWHDRQITDETLMVCLGFRLLLQA